MTSAAGRLASRVAGQTGPVLAGTDLKEVRNARHPTDSAVTAVLTLALAAPALADGDVSVSVDPNGLALVIGDAAANDVEVTPGPGADEITVLGLGTTLVNGAPGAVIASGVRSLRLEGGDGSDYFDVIGVNVRDLRARLDDGHDTLRMEDIVVRRRMSAYGGDGRDRIITAGHCVFRRSVRILAQDGRDDVQLRDVRVLGRVKLHGGEGDDRIIIHFSAFTRFARVRVVGGRGSDEVLLTETDFDEDVGVKGGRDDDHILVEGCGFDDDVEIDGGRGDDEVTLRNSDFDDEVELDGGSGHDDLDFSGRLRFAQGHHELLFVYSFEHRH